MGYGVNAITHFLIALDCTRLRGILKENPPCSLISFLLFKYHLQTTFGFYYLIGGELGVR